MKNYSYVIDLFGQEEIAMGEIKAKTPDEAKSKIMEELERSITIIEDEE
jgi:hypothetical protein